MRLGTATALGCAAALMSPGAIAGRAPTKRHDLTSLPAAAQGSVSAALGGDDPAYHVLGLHAVNPAQHLRVGFSGGSVTVRSGTARLAITLSDYGYASAPEPAGSVAPRVSANRVSYAHGSLSEWFANGPLGLEQGFDLAARPRRGSGPLTFSLTLSGNLAPRLRHGSLLLDGDGVSLRYGGLVATDAHGRTLRSWLELVRGRLLIRVEDRGAAYPVRIDPFVQQAELSDSRGTVGEELGESTAISGNTIVVGTPNYTAAATNKEQGAAYVFTMPRSGWADATQTARLTAEKGQSEELFGHSVSVSDNTIVVGAPFREVGRHTDQGAAYVFVKPVAGWRNATQTAKLTAGGGAAHEFFGESVAVSHDTVLVGVPGHTVGKHVMQGAVDVYARRASGWAGSLTQTAELTASDGNASDALGISVAISGNTIVAGADQHAVADSANEGAAYVFVKPVAGWRNATQTAELSDRQGQSGELFGHSVAVSGSTIVVGAPDREVAENAEQGALLVFTRPASGWAGSLAQTAELTASDGAKDELLGRSLAISGNTIVAGASFVEVAKNPAQGVVYVFAMPTSGWATATQTAELSASDGAAGNSLGRSVAVSGETIVAGAPDREVAGNIAQGAVYVFVAPSLSTRTRTRR